MHGLPEPEVREICQRAGGQVIGTRLSVAAGPEWNGLEYLATKGPLS